MTKILFLLFLPIVIFAQQTNEAFNCRVPPDYKDKIVSAKKVFASQIQSPSIASSVLFDWPVKQATGFSALGFWGISNYFDHNSSIGQVQDYNCGTRTYDVSGYNHSGTDIYPAPFGWKMMNDGQVEAIAAADGILLYKEDGNFDKNCDFNNPNWNVVVIQHSDGTTTIYGHLKNGSVTNKVIGSSIVKGEFLGKVGSSGNSTGPHLHFEVLDSNNNPIDPYTGTCNNIPSKWVNQKPYRDSGILNLMTHSAFPVFNSCPNQETTNEKTTFAAGESVLVVAYFRDSQINQTVNIKVYNPSNLIMQDYNITLPGNADGWSSQSLNYILPTNAPLGQWKTTLTYQGQTVTSNFTVTCVPPAAPSTTSAGRCGTGTVNLSASNCTGSLNWYTTLTGGTAFYVGTSYTTPSLTSTTNYYIDCKIGTCSSVTRSLVTATINVIPNAPTISNTTINSGQTATLTASGCSGIVNWYNVASGGSSLGTGNSFTTPTLNTTTIYYASCTINNCVSNSRGSGTVTVNSCTTPTATLSGTQTITNGQSANLTINFTGNSPYNLVFNGNTYANITTNPFTIPVTPSITTTYTLSSVNNSCGQGTVSGSAVITVNPAGCDPFEPNNTLNLAKIIPYATYQSPELCLSSVSDVDWYKVVMNDHTIFIKVSTGSSNASGKYYLKTNILSTSLGYVFEIYTIQGSGTITDTKIENYASDGMTILATSDNPGDGSTLHAYTNIIVPTTNCMESLDLHKNITSGVYKTNSTIRVSSTVPAVENLMDASKNILLEPGFIVNSGTTFTAKIGGCSNNVIPNTGLIAHYKLNFYNPLSDETRFGNTAALFNSSVSMWNRKYKYFCHDYNGTTGNAYVLINHQNQLNISNTFTYSIWYNLKSYYGMDGFRQNVANGNHVLLAKEGDRAGFYLAISNDTQNDKQRITYANVDANGTQNFFLIGKPIGTAADNLNVWNHLVITFNSNTMKMYINGIKVSETTGIVPNFAAANTKNLNVGRMFALNNSWYPFNGAADDLKIFNRILSDTEVLNLYNYEK